MNFTGIKSNMFFCGFVQTRIVYKTDVVTIGGQSVSIVVYGEIKTR